MRHTVHVAGTYDRQFGNYAENRATATIGWNMDKFDAQIGARFIDDIVLLLPSGGTLMPADNPPLPIDSFVYLDLLLRVHDQRQHQGVAERNEPERRAAADAVSEQRHQREHGREYVRHVGPQVLPSRRPTSSDLTERVIDKGRVAFATRPFSL